VVLFFAIYCFASTAIFSALAVAIGVLGNARMVSIYYALATVGLLAIWMYDRTTAGPDNTPLGALGRPIFYAALAGLLASFGIFRITLIWYRERLLEQKILLSADE